MRNRAKCKLCQSILESLAYNDYVTCSCGEIAINGGSKEYICFARDFKNFLRVDDEDIEIEVSVKEKDPDLIELKPDRTQMLNMLDEMIKSYDNLPQHAMITPINHYDFCSALVLLASIFKADCKVSS